MSGFVGGFLIGWQKLWLCYWGNDFLISHLWIFVLFLSCFVSFPGSLSLTILSLSQSNFIIFSHSDRSWIIMCLVSGSKINANECVYELLEALGESIKSKTLSLVTGSVNHSESCWLFLKKEKRKTSASVSGFLFHKGIQPFSFFMFYHLELVGIFWTLYSILIFIVFFHWYAQTSSSKKQKSLLDDLKDQYVLYVRS